jgi:hypothetical protein
LPGETTDGRSVMASETDQPVLVWSGSMAGFLFDVVPGLASKDKFAT